MKPICVPRGIQKHDGFSTMKTPEQSLTYCVMRQSAIEQESRALIVIKGKFEHRRKKSMKPLYAIALCTLMVGCATSKETFLPDGGKGHSINCSGSALNWGMCYEKAGEICGTKGYEVIAGGSDQGVVVAGNQYGLYGGSVMNRSMLIKCKN